MAGIKVIKMQQEQAIAAKLSGFPDAVCAASARITLAQLQRELTTDSNFRLRYEEAAAKAAKPPQW